VSVISTSISRDGVIGSTSRCRTAARDRVGTWITATCLVSCASNRTLRRITSSRSSAPSRKLRIARLSACESGLISLSLSTNSR
jgi:hypothetical protein